LGPPDFYLVHTGDDAQPGVQDLLHKRQEPRSGSGPNCFECSIAVDDLDVVTTAIAKHGGRIIMDKAPIPTVGILTKFQDTEGNVLGAMAYEQKPHTSRQSWRANAADQQIATCSRTRKVLADALAQSVRALGGPT
jgi:uncharacterized protein